MSLISTIAERVFRIEAESIKNLSQYLTADFDQAVEAILACRGRVVVCGMGKSGHIGKKIAATLASTGTPSFFMHPAEAFHGDLGMITHADIFMGLSNSGETEEIIRLIPTIKKLKCLFIAICGKKDTTMVRNADFFLHTFVAEEACPLQLAPTSSTTAALAMGDALAVALMEMRNFQPEDFAVFHPGGSLGKKLLSKAKDLMRTENLPLVEENADLKNLILTMTEGKLGLALIQKNGKLVGVVTDGDLRRAWTRNIDQDLEKLKISEIMTFSPKCVSPEMPIAEAEKMMMQMKITSLIVADQEKIHGVLQLYHIQ